MTLVGGSKHTRVEVRRALHPRWLAATAALAAASTPATEAQAHDAPTVIEATPQPAASPADAEATSNGPDEDGPRADARSAAERRLHWQWARFGIIDYVVTVGLAAGYLGVELAGQPLADPRWRGGILFDDAVRSAVVSGTRRGRDGMAVASDVFSLLPQLMMVVDSTIVPIVTDHGNVDVALQLTLIAARAEALTGLLSRAGHFYIGRERPDAAACRRNPEYSAGCFRGSTAGFPGGHVAAATVGAGVVCMHHWHLPVYGAGAWNAVPCAAGVVSAAFAGYTRMAADRHYLSDTLVGVALGVSAGFLLPWLTYRRSAGALEGSELRWTLTPITSADTTGLGVRGSF